jgi:hypothetical protein
MSASSVLLNIPRGRRANVGSFPDPSLLGGTRAA